MYQSQPTEDLSVCVDRTETDNETPSSTTKSIINTPKTTKITPTENTPKTTSNNTPTTITATIKRPTRMSLKKKSTSLVGRPKKIHSVIDKKEVSSDTDIDDKVKPAKSAKKSPSAKKKTPKSGKKQGKVIIKKSSSRKRKRSTTKTTNKKDGEEDNDDDNVGKSTSSSGEDDGGKEDEGGMDELVGKLGAFMLVEKGGLISVTLSLNTEGFVGADMKVDVYID